MIQLQHILIVFLILTLFLPLSFLSKRLNYFKFTFFIQIILLASILFVLNLNTDFYLNIFWWLFIVFISLNIQSPTSNWEWWFLILFIFIGLYIFLIGFITNFLGLFIILEAQVIVFLLLTQFENNSTINIEAIARWCLLNIVSSLFLMISFGMLYQSFGTINLVDLLLLDNYSDSYTNLAFVLFYSSFLFKIGIPPFHFWLPDIYETSNTHLVSILIAPIKLFYILILQYFVIIKCDVAFIFTPLGYFSMVVGLLITLNQTSIKRFLAWTGIFYFGAFILTLSNMTLDNILYLKIYINVYLFSSLVFVLLNQINLTRLSDFTLLFGDNFLLGLFFIMVLIIIIGLPVIAGFYTKLSFFYNLLVSNNSYIVLLLLLILTSFAGFYYLNTFIFGLSYKYLLQNINIIETMNLKLNWTLYTLLLFNLLLIFFPFQLSNIFLYLI